MAATTSRRAFLTAAALDSAGIALGLRDRPAAAQAPVTALKKDGTLRVGFLHRGRDDVTLSSQKSRDQLEPGYVVKRESFWSRGLKRTEPRFLNTPETGALRADAILASCPRAA